MSKAIAITATAAIVAMLAGTGLFVAMNKSEDQFAQCRSTTVGGGAIGGPFTLVNGQGETVTDTDVITKPSIVYFGYTFCPDVCPLDAARNAVAVDLLDEKGIETTPVFITIDPERDTPEVVKDYASNFHDRMIGLTGSTEQVKAASTAYKTYYRKQESDDPDYYLMDHSTFSYLVLPEHGFVEFFRRDTTPEQIAETTACYVGAT